MKKIVLGLLVALSFALAENKSIEGFSSPESVLIVGEDVYISNVGKELKPSEKDGDGFISKMDKNGNVKELKFITGLNAPKGMATIDDTLFVTDVDTLKGFDLKTKKQVFELTFPDTVFLNDLTKGEDDTLYVSATDTGEVYAVDIKEKSYKKTAHTYTAVAPMFHRLSKKDYKKISDIRGANGLFYDNGMLYAVNFPEGVLYSIDLKSGKKTKVGTITGMLDGVLKIGDTLYVSDWVEYKPSGVLKTYDLKSGEEATLSLPKFTGAADFAIDPKTMILYMPEMMDNKVTIIDLKQP